MSRRSIKTFDDLIEEGKVVELKNQQIKNYKENPNISIPWSKDKPKIKKHTDKNKSEKEMGSPIAAIKDKSHKEKKTPNTNKQKAFPQPEINKNSSDQSKPVSEKTAVSDLPEPGQCFKCRKFGHVWKDCPNEGHKYFCYGCGKPNVIRTKCLHCVESKEGNSQAGQS